MKGLIAGSVLLAALAGCQEFFPTVEEMDAKQVGNGGRGMANSVDSLRQGFKTMTGKDLIAPRRLDSCYDAECRFAAWKNAYNDQWYDIQQAKQHQEELEKKQEENICLTKPACRKEMDKAKVKRLLQNAYETIVTSFTNNYSEGDSFFREFCGQSATTQRQGMSKAALVDRVEDLPGISPNYRQLLVETAETCWDSSKLGMSWKEAIRIPRRR